MSSWTTRTLDAQFVEVIAAALCAERDSSPPAAGRSPARWKTAADVGRAGQTASARSKLTAALPAASGRHAGSSNWAARRPVRSTINLSSTVVALAGTLAVSLVNLGSGSASFRASATRSPSSPRPTASAAAFDTLVAPSGFNWNINYGTNSVELIVGIPGDYNDDGIVDAADYTTWRNSLGTIGQQSAGRRQRQRRDRLGRLHGLEEQFRRGCRSGRPRPVAVPEPTAMLRCCCSRRSQCACGLARRLTPPVPSAASTSLWSVFAPVNRGTTRALLFIGTVDRHRHLLRYRRVIVLGVMVITCAACADDVRGSTWPWPWLRRPLRPGTIACRAAS